MQDGLFARVKAAIARDPEVNLAALGLQLKKAIKGTWTQCECPVCPDKSGSCSVTPQGHIKCHQCSAKLDVFEWIAQQRSSTTWDVCRDLAKQFHVPDLTDKAQGAKVTRNRWPGHWSEELAERAAFDLWDSDKNAHLRQFLAQRKIDDPVRLTELGVGAMNGCLVFTQWDSAAKVKGRVRAYDPSSEASRWRWIGSASRDRVVGLYPLCQEVPDGGVIFVTEGEWDFFTADIRLQMRDQGIYSFTHTGGAGQPWRREDIPKSWHGKEIHLCYDNDVFQGVDLSKYWAPDAKKRTEMLHRCSVLFSEIVPLLQSCDCKVKLRKVPIDPREKWGADFRDWINAGNTNLDDLPVYDAEELPNPKDQPHDCTMREVFSHVGELVRFRCTMTSVEQDGLLILRCSKIICDMNGRPECSRCDVPRKFSNGLFQWTDHPSKLAGYLSSPTDATREQFLHRQCLGKPSSCPQVEVKPIDYSAGVRWWAETELVEGAGDNSLLELMIVSVDRPPMAGEVEVTGRVHPMSGSAMVLADKIVAIDKIDADIEPHIADYLSACPGPNATADSIDEYLSKRTADLSTNVTTIHGRDEVHLAYDLLLHSALGFYAPRINQKENRGWLDICIYGDTRSGKSATVRALIAHTGIGFYKAAIESTSRAGLVLGSEQRNGRWLTRPGVWPRQHKKLFVLDEFHFIVNKNQEEHPMRWLQSARDEGVVHGIKMGTADKSLPAKVRFACISNWVDGTRDTYHHVCEHLIGLYGEPEIISRLDYAIAVIGEPKKPHGEVPHFWTSERTRALALRAWAQRPEDVIFEDGVEQAAMEHTLALNLRYTSERVPIFTEQEKVLSILRIAIACANLCFSHIEKNVHSVLVTKAHVEWAARWLTRTYRSIDYDNYCEAERFAREVREPLMAEVLLFKLPDFSKSSARLLLEALCKPFTREEFLAIYGDQQLGMIWIAQTVRHNIFRAHRGRRGVSYKPTSGGARLIRNIVEMVTNYPEEFDRRRERLLQWASGGVSNAPDDLAPMDRDTDTLREEWDNDGYTD